MMKLCNTVFRNCEKKSKITSCRKGELGCTVKRSWKNPHNVKGYTVHSPNDHSTNDQSSNDHSQNDQSQNDQSPNDQSSEQLNCDHSQNATISRTTNLRMQLSEIRTIGSEKKLKFMMKGATIFSLKNWVWKDSVFVLISEMLPYLSDIMRPKKVIVTKSLRFMLFANNLFRCIL
jgi:hypothetical protein